MRGALCGLTLAALLAGLACAGTPVAIPVTPKASATKAGKAKLSVAPVDALDPIALGANDPAVADARYPTAHGASHNTTDAVPDATDSVHGLMPATASVKLNGITTGAAIKSIVSESADLTVTDDAGNISLTITPGLSGLDANNYPVADSASTLTQGRLWQSGVSNAVGINQPLPGATLAVESWPGNTGEVSLKVGSVDDTSYVRLDGDTDAVRAVYGCKAGARWWGIQLGDGTATSAGFEGANFGIEAWDDEVTYTPRSVPFFIRRSDLQFGIHTTAPTTTFDINGGARVRGLVSLDSSGFATMTAGIVTVACQTVTVTSPIFVTPRAGNGAPSTWGHVVVTNIVPYTSFDISSTSPTDTRSCSYVPLGNQ